MATRIIRAETEMGKEIIAFTYFAGFSGRKWLLRCFSFVVTVSSVSSRKEMELSLSQIDHPFFPSRPVRKDPDAPQ